MLEYDRIDISESIDVKECNETSRQCSLCKFYYFLNKNFNYQKRLCDGCHDISTKATSMQNLAIIYHKENAFRVNFVFIGKNDAFNLIENSNIIDKRKSVIMSFYHNKTFANNLDRINVLCKFLMM